MCAWEKKERKNRKKKGKKEKEKQNVFVFESVIFQFAHISYPTLPNMQLLAWTALLAAATPQEQWWPIVLHYLPAQRKTGPSPPKKTHTQTLLLFLLLSTLHSTDNIFNKSIRYWYLLFPLLSKKSHDVSNSWPSCMAGGLREISMLMFSHKPSGAPGSKRKKVWV